MPLPANIKDIIAESVHEAVTEVIDQVEAQGGGATLRADAKIKGRCLYYAAAVWHLTEQVLGQEFELQIGGIVVEIADGQVIQIDFKAGGIAKRSFHMWIARQTPAGAEIVDLTSRFFKGWAVQGGHPWDRADIPDYLWGTFTELRDIHKVLYRADYEDCQPLLDANEPLIMAIVARGRQLIDQKIKLVTASKPPTPSSASPDNDDEPDAIADERPF